MASASSGQNISYSDTAAKESSISDGKTEISYEEFKKWLSTNENKDGNPESVEKTVVEEYIKAKSKSEEKQKNDENDSSNTEESEIEEMKMEVEGEES